MTQQDSAISDQLLAALRNHTGTPNLDYVEAPQRLTGGNETLTYAFSLASPPDETLTGPLVLRLFGNPGDINQSRREAAFQNSLADLGYPVPRVVARFDSGIGNRPFNIMVRIAGKALMDGADIDPATIESVIDRLAKVHTRLHQVPSGPVIAAMTKAGIPLEPFTYEGRMRFVSRYFEGDTLDALRPCHEWLVANRPPELESPAVCHGDFHPGNIMVDGDKITGVIDWPGAAFADPEHDVATTLVLIKAGAGELKPELQPLVLQIADLYLHSYTQISPLNIEKVDYYEVARSFRAFTRGTALLTPSVGAGLAPRDHYPWAGEFAMRSLQSRIAEITGINLPMPTTM